MKIKSGENRIFKIVQWTFKLSPAALAALPIRLDNGACHLKRTIYNFKNSFSPRFVFFFLPQVS